MSTPADCAAFRAWAATVPPPRAVLYLGPRDRDHLAAVRAGWPVAHVTTLDHDRRLRPGLLCDLDRDRLPPGRSWDVCVAASVLMYLSDPAAACRRLLASCAVLCVQEPVLRARPDADPWPDRWRFVGPGAPAGLVLRARREAGASGRGVCDLSGVGTLTHEAYYPDGGSVSGLWSFTP